MTATEAPAVAPPASRARATAEPVSRRLTVDGRDIHYRTHGQGPPVVFVHGWPTDCNLWRHQMPALAEHCTSYALDLPGMGASARPEAVRYSLDFHARTLAGFLDGLGLERASIVCHDLGGMVALLFAARAPERLDRFVVMDTLPYPMLPPALVPVLAAGRVPGLRRLLVSRTVIRSMLRLGMPNARARIDELTDIYYRPYAGDAAARRVLLRTLLEAEVRELAEAARGFGRITAPTLILWAEKDWLLPPSYARRLQRDIPGATLQLVPRCSHFLSEDRPEVVTRHLLRFLVSNGPSA